MEPLDQPLERRGRWWVFGSFVFCPCHLPLTLALLASVFGGTTIGVLVRDHAWVAGTIVTAAWILGTWYGFRLLRRARAGGGCSVSTTPENEAASAAPASVRREPAVPSLGRDLGGRVHDR